MICFVLSKAVIQCAEVVDSVGVSVGSLQWVEDSREGEAKNEVVLGAAGEFAGVEGGEGEEVGFGEGEGVEPVDGAFVAVRCVSCCCTGTQGDDIVHTFGEGSLEWLCV